ncbi:MAG: hypothetical protein V3W45_05770, partial [Sedimentisphaerales bacterium]
MKFTQALSNPLVMCNKPLNLSVLPGRQLIINETIKQFFDLVFCPVHYKKVSIISLRLLLARLNLLL